MVVVLFVVVVVQVVVVGLVDVQQEVNWCMVLVFYEKGLNEKDVDVVFVYVGDCYVQYNLNVVDGCDGFCKFVVFLCDKYLQLYSEIKCLFVDGDYVILYVYVVCELGMCGSVIMDVFWFEYGKIVEYWDVNQLVFEQVVNGNMMF